MVIKLSENYERVKRVGSRFTAVYCGLVRFTTVLRFKRLYQVPVRLGSIN